MNERVRPRTHRNRSGDESASSGAAASHRYSCRIPSVCRIYYLSFCENSSRSDIGRLDARRHG